jgi:hypothetical protein
MSKLLDFYGTRARASRRAPSPLDVGRLVGFGPDGEPMFGSGPIAAISKSGKPIPAIAGGAQGGAGTLQRAQPELSTVERQPQTTQAAAIGPFTRHSRKASLQAFERAGLVFSASLREQLKPVGGYLRALNILVQGAGGTGGTFEPDGPYNAIQSLLLRDPFGEPIVQADGYALRLIDMYGGQGGFWNAADPANLPSFAGTPPNTVTRIRVPVEVTSSDAYCSIPLLNAAAVPSLDITLNTEDAIFATLPAPDPTYTVRVEEEYWVAPVDNPSLAPPDVGSSAQWSIAPGNPLIGSGANVAVELPRKGAWIHTLILVLRDSLGARIDSFPNPMELWIDGTPYLMEPLTRRTDEMFETFGVTRPTGVMVYTFRDSVMPAAYPDTADEWLHTTPGTLLEIRGTWGTIANAPARLDVITGECYPNSGSPYSSHLTD